MFYGNNKFKKAGIAREPIIRKELSEALQKAGFINRIDSAGLHEDTKNHVDARIHLIGPSFHGWREIPIDIKTSESFTIINGNGDNTLEHSKSVYLVYEYSPESDHYVFIKISRLKEVMALNRPIIQIGKNPVSRYFWLRDYIESNSDKFNSEEIFTVNK